MKIPICEIFVSYQGEGFFVGTKNLFIRFGRCNLSCSYCDEFKNKYKNLSLGQIVNYVDKIVKKDRSLKMISFTGGEPLLHVDFLVKLIRKLKGDFSFLLETNSTLVSNLEKIIDNIDVVSADIKLPQYCGGDFFDLHKEFLKIASRKFVYVKVVFDYDLIIEDFKKAVNLVASVDKNIPFFIQPEANKFMREKDLNFIDKLYSIASHRLKSVRFLPQVHKLFNMK